MIYLFSILYLSWALWRRDWSIYSFDFDISFNKSEEQTMAELLDLFKIIDFSIIQKYTIIEND
jgi:hypothetical protein